MECSHCHKEIIGKECSHCGANIPLESRYCMECGTNLEEKAEDLVEEAEDLLEEDDGFDFENRVLCPDGNCTGIIIDGKCSECGKPHKGG